MKIVVCVKQVPASTSVKMDPETKRLVREGVESILNPFDLSALETALRLRDAVGGEIVALSMGPPKAEAVLREAIAFGADRAVLLSDRFFGGSDTWSTSYVLAQAIRKIGAVDLVLCGKQAIDGDTAQVGPGIAAHLQITQAAEVNALTPSGADLTARRVFGNGKTDQCRLRLPAVVAVTKDIYQPRVPRLVGWLRAERAELTLWNAEAISADGELIGLKGSPTRVVSTSTPAPRGKNTQWWRGAEEESAKLLLAELRGAFTNHAEETNANH